MAEKRKAPWTEKGGRLHAGYRFKDFVRAMGFLQEVAFAAEKMQHHPDFHVHWNEVRFELWSHDAGKVTERDHKLSDRIATIAKRHRAEPM